jgi:hypothetical protein
MNAACPAIAPTSTNTCVSDGLRILARLVARKFLLDHKVPKLNQTLKDGNNNGNGY